ncbi:hypothetical protein [Natronosalvus amylolyticus]|uniref:hypothetical protein n=1 Tax=Natronosalvus amylolyticus TaxID=2961994 RepID=UPI0020CA14C3|nr:hypothetical protein [Natronosalvus amylolyticus]
MALLDHTRELRSARRLLYECEGTPFAPSERTHPLVERLEGRRTNADLDARNWLEALEATEGEIAIYLELAADHEWWLAFDADSTGSEYDREFDGPYHHWSTHPSGPWKHSSKSRSIMLALLEELYEFENQIRASRVVRLDESPKFVRHKVNENE